MRKNLTALAMATVMASAFAAGTASAAPGEYHKDQHPNWSQTDNPGQGSDYQGKGSQGKGEGWLHGIGVGHGKGPVSPH